MYPNIERIRFYIELFEEFNVKFSLEITDNRRTIKYGLLVYLHVESFFKK